MIIVVKVVNRKEGNDQESIKLPNTFRSKIPNGKKDALKVTAPQSKHYKQKSKPCKEMTDILNHSRSIALERSVKKNYWRGGGGGWGGGWGSSGGLTSILRGHNPSLVLP